MVADGPGARTLAKALQLDVGRRTETDRDPEVVLGVTGDRDNAETGANQAVDRPGNKLSLHVYYTFFQCVMRQK